MRGSLRDWWEIARPFSWTASVVPVLVGAAVAADLGFFRLPELLLTLVGAVLLQIGTNIVNEVVDVERGVDTAETAGASRVVLEGRLPARTAFRAGVASLVAALVIGLWLAVRSTLWVLGLGALGALAGYLYTAGPKGYKYLALGVPLVFLLMGPLEVLASFMVQSGRFDLLPVWTSLPVGFLVAAILHGNDMRDLALDRRAGIATLAGLVGLPTSAWIYRFLLAGAYGVVLLLAALQALPWTALLVLLSLPAAAEPWRHVTRGLADERELLPVEPLSARLHMVFGLLLALGTGLPALLGAVGL
ncbi:MAG: 1,4-dihydroxy-2-naphthoate octaprenyltransferase [Clostridia bacterium]|nr:1,4-dihydroxy-2-naphthoate octaprenyltransferase [Clostridia bacterium]